MVLREMERLTRSRYIDQLVLATSTDVSDDPLCALAKETGVNIYRGSLDDVLDRYYACAKEYGAEHIVRVTGDCPLIDYTHTTERFPDGLDTEIMTFAALAQAYREARLTSEREHVTLYFRNHPERFRIGSVDCAEDYGDLRWTVDEPCDFSFVEAVYEKLYAKNNDFSMQDILSLLKEQPDLRALNQGVVRNEGLLKSLAEDTK